MAGKAAKHYLDLHAQGKYPTEPVGFREKWAGMEDADKLGFTRELASRGLDSLYGRKKTPPTATEVLNELHRHTGNLVRDFKDKPTNRHEDFLRSGTYAKATAGHDGESTKAEPAAALDRLHTSLGLGDQHFPSLRETMKSATSTKTRPGG
jgi:hypothetical protein